ncbi:prolipoprotein diacylglyceryl transferase [Alteromonas sp. LMIT006]|jgi:phosphatidylglycerol:prolipoprotein diacylglycerol transferase|uniref:prolipoprotein diacylglyceryl transferase n=1 Tax=Alteromonadaceae TaxID=72275 RepID=UPI0020CA64E6|nr:prolipoprotein diacylglyceryl transferase [Alteromonas sp. LMIT006]UTP73554.1 prolipoprotein diacylglyceryl transferase [Alteromonas sp. LMIT006]
MQPEQSYWVFEAIDPVIFSIGPLAVRWYGLMYLVGFVAAYYLAKSRMKRIGWNEDDIGDLLFWGFVGVVAGGRVGYVLFYQFSSFLADPLYLFKIWTGGMSFHGGLIGVLVALWLFARKKTVSFLTVGDFVAPIVPLGLAAGRIGNFINGELWGRVTDVPWAIVFPAAGPEPRHPSQLYQFALEGLTLFVLIWLFSRQPRPTGAVGGLFLAGYGVFRFIVEFARQPDAHLGLNTLGLSQGQMLSIPMILLGLGLIVYAYKYNNKEGKA